MSVYKEGFYAIELIQKNSKQLFQDAADYGAPVKKQDQLWGWVKQLCDWYGVEGSRQEHRYGTGVTVEQNVSLMDEWNTGKKIYYKVVYVSAKLPGYDGYVYVKQI